MTEQNLGIYIWPRRTENIKIKNKFKFNTYDLYSLSKWISSNNNNNNVSSNTKVFYSIDYTDPSYQLINWELFKNQISDPLFKFYKKIYIKKNWFNEITPRMA